MTDRGKPIGLLSWFIARRYLFLHERKALASTITLISMIGVAVGVAALIVVIGVMDGAKVRLYGKMTDLFPNLKISAGDDAPFPVTAELLERIRKDPDVIFVQPVLEQPESAVLTSTGNGAQNVKFIRLIAADDLNANPIYKDTIQPKGEAVRLGPGEILLGRPLAESIKAAPGGVASIITIGRVKNAVQPPMSRKPLQVKGIFDTGFYLFDNSAAFISTAEMRRLFGVKEGMASYLYVRLRDPFQAEKVRDRLDLPPQYFVVTWAQLNNDFFTALKFEKIALFIILLLIILVAAFNIIGTLILMVIEKTREVGILRALGASEGLIMRVFILDGVSVGALGTLLGVVIGVTIGLIIPVIKIDMPPAVYNFDHLPVQINPLTVAIIVASSLSISVLAAVFPARQAAKLNPVEALRYD